MPTVESRRPALTVYVVHHPDDARATELADGIFRWFRLVDTDGLGASAGFPVWFVRHLDTGSKRLKPEIPFDGAEYNLVILLLGDKLVLDPNWLAAVEHLLDPAESGAARRDRNFLPIALTGEMPAIHRLSRLNGLRIRQESCAAEQLRSICHAATELAARAILTLDRDPGGDPDGAPAEMKVFVSHAKADGRDVAVKLRSAIREFGQMTAWFDENDLPWGHRWASRIHDAATERTEAFLAVVTSTYPTRPWCRAEVLDARTPHREGASRVWTLRPAVAVHAQGRAWARGVPALAGVPQIGWDADHPDEVARAAVDRLALEILLQVAWRRTALALASEHQGSSCWFLTFPPDAWTVQAILAQIGGHEEVEILHPGSGMRAEEEVELLQLFPGRVRFSSYDECFRTSPTASPS